MPRKSNKRRAAEKREKAKADKKKIECESPLGYSNETIDIQNDLNIIAGSLHQGNSRFEYPGVQCAFISFYALLCMIDKPPQLWTFSDIDACVIEGNDFFIKHCNERKMRPQMLLASELPQRMTVGIDIYECVQLDNSIEIGLLGTKETEEDHWTSTLTDAMVKALTRFGSCLLFCGGLTVAIAKRESLYFVFDPHSRGNDGLLHSDGSAVLVSFPCIRKASLFLERLFTQSLRLSLLTQFELVPLTITKTQPIMRKTTISAKNDIIASQSDDPVTQLASEQSAHKIANELSEKSMDTYFDDQFKRDKAHKQKHCVSKSTVDSSKRKEYMKNYMRSVRQKQRYKIKQNTLSRKRMKEILSTEEGRIQNREWASKGMKRIRNTPEGRAKSRESVLKSMRLIRNTIEGQTQNKETASKAMKERRSTSQGQAKNRESGSKSMKKLRNTLEGKMKNRETAAKAMKEKRSTSEGQAKNRESASKSMTKIRNTPEGQVKNRETAGKAMKERRSTSEGQAKSRESGSKSVAKIRNSSEGKMRNREIAAISMNKSLATDDGKIRHNMSSVKTMKKLRKRKTFCEKEAIKRKKRKTDESFSNAVNRFNDAISGSCSYVCTCCHQLWFRQSVKDVSTFLASSSIDTHLLKRCKTGFISENGIEWICSTCLCNIRQGKLPKLSVNNGMEFPEKPPELDLNNLEERLISLRIPFMQIRSLNSGGQFSLKGSVVNVPTDIEPTIRALPRMLHESETIPVKLKRMKDFKHAVQTENIRPLAVMTALKFLVNSSELYKQANIKIDDEWHASTMDKKTQSDSSKEHEEDSDDFSEEESDDKMPVVTFLDEQTYDKNEVLSVAPGEGQRPLSMFKDSNSEYLAFPTIFCGTKRKESSERQVPVYYSDICKWELRSVDRRVALNIPNIFYKMKKLQTQQICNKSHLAVRRCKTKGKHYSAGYILSDNMGESLVRLDEGYRIFRTIRNSPQYWENQKKEVFAMIRQLGIPTLFLSFSANDLNWLDLIVTLGKLVDHKDYSEEAKDGSLSWETRSRLVQSDPVTCVRHFDNRVSQFIQTVLKSESSPLGVLSDYFYRVEFQQRGSPHIHMLAWIKDAPKYDKSDEADVLKYIDSIVSCSGDVQENLKQYIDLQRHKHSRSCRKGTKAECRFGIPFPPMRKTVIVQPFTGDDRLESEKHYTIVQNSLRTLETDIPFDDFLSQIGLDENDYMRAVQTSITSEKIFLKRKPIENRINPYIKDMLDVWKANHDIQYVLDAYACAMYIVSYINKSCKGMSSLMAEACKEAKTGNKSLKESVRHIGNKFLNAVEVSAQEAAYLVLQLNMSCKSRSCEFLPTAPPSERTFLLKSREELEALPEESTDIEANNIVKRYSKRPDTLENYCLADYVSKVISVKKIEKEDPQTKEQLLSGNQSDEDDNDTFHHSVSGLFEKQRYSVIIEDSKITLRSNPKIIRYVKYNKTVDPENFFREQLMLFYPWRNEETDLLNGCDTYEMSYQSVCKTIEITKQEYDRNSELLDQVEVATTGLGSNLFENVSPNMECREAKDAENEPIPSSKFSFYEPQTQEQANYDLAADIGITSHIANDDVEMVQNIIPESEYLKLLAVLNSKQRQVFTHIIQSLTFEPDKKLRLFITGGAGVGKSLVISTLYQTLHRLLCSDSGRNPEDIRILLCAYTGLAAYNIKGSTLHSAFCIEPNKNLKYKPLSDDKRNTLQTKYRHLSILIIDEVSMVGNEMLNFLYFRLQEIKGNKDHFGGVHILLVGDLFQLRPVGDGWIFVNTSSDYSSLGPNLWRTHFKMFELTEIMRQKDDSTFAQLLNRIREGNQTETDLAVLEARSVKADTSHYQSLKHELHLFPSNAAVDSHNSNMFESAVTEKAEIKCFDSVLGEDSVEVKQRLLNQLKGKKTNDTGNLSEKLQIAVGLQYDTTHNISIEDGICNGTPCFLRMIHYMEEEKGVPSCLWVEFPDVSIGQNMRREYSHYYKRYPSVSQKWTPIWCIRRTFMFRRKAIVRQQYPLKPSSAKTIHKAQGQTKSCIVVDTTGSRSHQHYVALSRVTNLVGLHLLNGLNGKIRVDSSVVNEMKRLREEAYIDLSYRPVSSSEGKLAVVFQNAQSLRLHFPQIKNDDTFTKADIICLAETRLQGDDKDLHYAIEGFQPIIRNDQQSEGHRPPHGLAIYLKKCFKVCSVELYSTKNIEMITIELVDARHDISYIILLVYKAPSCSWDDFQTCMKSVKVRSTNKLIILGDFNSDISNHRNKTFISFMNTIFPMARLLDTLPTTHGNTMLDLCFTACESASAYVIACVWSYHHTLIGSFA